MAEEVKNVFRDKRKLENIFHSVELGKGMEDKILEGGTSFINLKLNRNLFESKNLKDKIPQITETLFAMGIKVATIEMPIEKIFNLESCLMEELSDQFFLPPIGLATFLGNRNSIGDIPNNLQLNTTLQESKLGKGNRLCRPTIILNFINGDEYYPETPYVRDMLSKIVISDDNPLTMAEEISMHIKTMPDNIDVVTRLINEMKIKNGNLSLYLSLRVDTLEDLLVATDESMYEKLLGSIYLHENIETEDLIKIRDFIDDNELNIAIISGTEALEEFENNINILAELKEEEEQLFVWE